MEAHGNSTLKIGGEEQGQFRILLQAIEQFGGFVRLVAIEKGGSQRTVIANEPTSYLLMVSRNWRYSGC